MTHARHGCYLIPKRYVCLGTKRTLSEKPGTMDKSARSRTKRTNEEGRRRPTGLGHPAPIPDIRPLGATAVARALQQTSYRRRTSGRPPGHPARAARTSGARPEIRHLPTEHHSNLTDLGRTSGPQARTSGTLMNRRTSGLEPGHPARRPRNFGPLAHLPPPFRPNLY
jgi:hypothetical protein